MIKYCTAILSLLLIAAAIAAPAFQFPTDDRKVPMTQAPLNNADQKFQFVIMSDRNGGNRPDIFDQAVKKVNQLQPEFVICVGDLINGYTENTDHINQQWQQVDAELQQLTMPFFFVPGNHDLTNPAMLDIWNQRYGADYYHFIYQDVLFLVLNSELFPGNFLDDPQAMQQQLDYVKTVLDNNPQVRWTMIFLHKPVWQKPPAADKWAQITQLLNGRDVTIFAGHTHNYLYEKRDGRDYYILATTGGASQLRGTDYGEFDHVVWVTMKPQSPPVITNLLLDGILPNDIRTPAKAQIFRDIQNSYSISSLLYNFDGDTRTGTVQIPVKNDTDYPMQLIGSVDAHPALVALPVQFNQTIPAHSSIAIPVEIKIVTPSSNRVYLPLNFQWNVNFDQIMGKLNYTADHHSIIGLEPPQSCPPAAAAKTIDGKLDDWNQLRYNLDQPMLISAAAQAYHGTKDLNAGFDCAYDDKFLYIAVAVKDDRLVLDPAKDVWNQDGVEIRIDARDDPARTHKPIAEDKLFRVLVSPAPMPDQPFTSFRPKEWPQGTQVAVLAAEAAYNVEIALPVAYLDKVQGKAWQGFRLNLAVDDVDDSGPVSQIWWRPDWRKEQSYPGSGTFLKTAPADKPE